MYLVTQALQTLVSDVYELQIRWMAWFVMKKGLQTSCQSSRPTISASLFTAFVLIYPLLLEIEVEEISQKLELMERNYAHIEAIQSKILQTQSKILSHLEKVERALLATKA